MAGGLDAPTDVGTESFWGLDESYSPSLWSALASSAEDSREYGNAFDPDIEM